MSPHLLLFALAMLLGLVVLYRVTLAVNRRAEFRTRVLEVLAATVRHGLPVAPVLFWAAEEQKSRADRKALLYLGAAADQGTPLGESLEDCGRPYFARHAVAAIRAADGGQQVVPALQAAAADSAASLAVAHRVWLAFLYPFVLLIVIALMGFLLGAAWGSPVHGRLVEIIRSMDVASTVAFRRAALASDIAFVSMIGAVVLLIACIVFGRLKRIAGPVGRQFRAIGHALPGYRRAARMLGASRLLRATAGLLRAGVPLGEALRRAAPCADHKLITRSAVTGADLLESGAANDTTWEAVFLPRSMQVRATVAAGRPADGLADTLDELAAECAQHHRDAVDAVIRRMHPATLLLLGVLVLTQFSGIFSLLEAARKSAMPW